MGRPKRVLASGGKNDDRDSWMTRYGDIVVREYFPKGKGRDGDLDDAEAPAEVEIVLLADYLVLTLRDPADVPIAHSLCEHRTRTLLLDLDIGHVQSGP